MDNPPVISLEDSEQKEIYQEIGKYFVSCYGSSASFFVRVPGRVNLIGEHIDYCGFSVLPMAIEQDIIIAVRINQSGILNLRNFDSKKYKNFSASVDDLFIDKSAPQWFHYFICGYKGVAEKYELKEKSLDVVVKGTVPPSSGLSSSSALVCASALATCFANRISLNKTQMAALCAVSERLIGTEGGGMDQAIGFLAESGTAKLIGFNPLRTSDVPLPDDIVFVICNSCVSMNKASSSQFNIRVVECRLAAKVLAKKHGLNWREIKQLAEIPVLLQKDISDMKSIVCKIFTEKFYKRSELCSLFEITDDEFANMLSANTQDLENFQLRNRAIHVFEEAARVKKFKLVCEENRDSARKLGQLMNESHASCKDLYECSHPVLDELVKTALNCGALGSRLTGAGWGGCSVSLVKKNCVETFLNNMKKNFYNEIAKNSPEIDINAALFVTKPGTGAAIYILNV